MKANKELLEYLFKTKFNLEIDLEELDDADLNAYTDSAVLFHDKTVKLKSEHLNTVKNAIDLALNQD